MKKLVILGVAMLIASASVYSDPVSQKAKSVDICPMHVPPQTQATVMTHRDHQAMLAHSAAVSVQDDGQDDEQPAPHRISPGDGCSSVNPNAKPDTEFNGVRPNTVGCTCVKQCVNDHPQEDLRKDERGVYICRNASHKDRCFCPDPCKS